MPVTLRHTLPGCSFALWRIDEDTARLAPLCTGQENAWAGTLAPERRRREWLAWHAALHEEAPAEETFYRPSGAPALRSGRHIAVSHAGGYAALMLCDVPCGLDIERADRDFTKTEERFLAPDERKLLESAAACPPASSGAPKKPSTNGRDSADSTGSAISASRRSIRSGKRSKERPEESASG